MACNVLLPRAKLRIDHANFQVFKLSFKHMIAAPMLVIDLLFPNFQCDCAAGSNF